MNHELVFITMALGKKDKKAVVEETAQIVTFQVGSEEYGLDIHSITEAVRPLKITPLPRMPRFVEGVINLRGTIIPLVDLRKRFGVSSGGGDARTLRMVIVRGAVHGAGGPALDLVGLVVDRVREVLYVPRAQIAPAPQAATGAQADFIAAVAKTADRLIILIDVGKILSREERSALAEAQQEGP